MLKYINCILYYACVCQLTNSEDCRHSQTTFVLAMTDTHIGLAVIFDVPEGQDTATHKANFYAKSRKGTKELLYYGFASLGNKVLSIIKN